MRRKQKEDSMDAQEKYEKKMEEAFLAHMGKCYEEQMRLENQDIGKKAPASLDRWVQELRREKWGVEPASLKRKRTVRFPNRRRKAVWKAASLIIILAGALVGIAGTAKGVSFPWRKATLKDEGTSLIINSRLEDEEKNADSQNGVKGYYYPEYIPEGYVLTEKATETMVKKFAYENQDDKIIFYCSDSETSFALDKEQSRCEVVQIGGQTYYFAAYSNQCILHFFLEEYAISLCYNNLTEEEVRNILQNISFFLEK